MDNRWVALHPNGIHTLHVFYNPLLSHPWQFSISININGFEQTIAEAEAIHVTDAIPWIERILND